ncbi:MAG: VWA domain-containing protein [Planctomycetia bacterium]|nr:VWA domain-containing protein [Planctomycetia bacterium]
MWQPQGDKLNNPDRLGSLQPVIMLSDVEGQHIFTCMDSNDDLQLAFQCGQEGPVRRYIVVPFADQLVAQLQAGTLGLREALTQTRTWLADVGADGQVQSAWKTDLAKLPANVVPPPGTLLPPPVLEEEIPMAMPVDEPVAAAPPPPAPRPAAAAPAPAARAPAPAPAAPAAPAAPRPMGKSGRINIERMTHRNSIQVMGESAATYALIKLIPSGEPGKAPPLNLALVIDISGSMFQEDGTGVSRLSRVQEAAKLALEKLRPDDTLAIVGFAYDAKVLLPPTSIADKAKIIDVINRVDDMGIDGGGTAMDEGMKLSIEAVEKLVVPEKLTQLVILTDGETTGEVFCRKLAEQAAEKKIHLTMIGVGTEWNAPLLKDLAKLSQGKWHYIDVTVATDTERVIVEEFKSLAATGFLNTEMHVRALKGVKVKKLRQVAPEIKVHELQEPEERHLIAHLGTLVRDNPTKYILELSVPKRPDGKFSLAQLEISFDPGTGKREATSVPLEIIFSSTGHGFINAEVAKHIDEVQVAELNENLQKAIASDKKDDVQKVAALLVKKGEVMGKAGAKKTMLAKQVLQEINSGGRVSKKTQLAMDDAARMASEQ